MGCPITHSLERYECREAERDAEAEAEEREREIYRRKRCRCGRFFSPSHAFNTRCLACCLKMKGVA